jgi:hypothetical protein
VGQTLDLHVRLEVEGRSESVSVTAEVPVVETMRTQLTQTIQPAEVASLPLNGRNYLDLALLTPGVSRQNQNNNDQFSETSAVPGTTISINGQRNLSNAFVVDGLSANDDAASCPAFYSQEVVREFQVVTSGGIAEFGRSMGGTVNILTKSGANQWRGAAYRFLRSRNLDGATPSPRSATRSPGAVRRQHWRADPARPDVSVFEFRAAAPESHRLYHHLIHQRHPDQQPTGSDRLRNRGLRPAHSKPDMTSPPISRAWIIS